MNRKKQNSYQCFYFLLIAPGLQGGRKQKKILRKLLREEGNASTSLSALFQTYLVCNIKVGVHPQTQAASCSAFVCVFVWFLVGFLIFFLGGFCLLQYFGFLPSSHLLWKHVVYLQMRLQIEIFPRPKLFTRTCQKCCKTKVLIHGSEITVSISRNLYNKQEKAKTKLKWTENRGKRKPPEDVNYRILGAVYCCVYTIWILFIEGIWLKDREKAAWPNVVLKILAPLLLSSHCLMVPCGICRVIFSYSKMSASTCMREQASSSWRSTMFSLLIQEFTPAQWWTALGRRLCLQSSLFKVQQRGCRTEKRGHRHSDKMSLLCSWYLQETFTSSHFLLLSFSFCSLNGAVVAWNMLQL